MTSSVLDNKVPRRESNNTDDDLDEAFVSAEYGVINEDDEKTAVSRAMEQLLVDMDHRSESPSDSNENLKASSEDEGDDEVFNEYRKHLSSRDSIASHSDNEQNSSSSKTKSSSAKSSSSGDKLKKSGCDSDSKKSTEDLDATEKSVLRSVQQMSDNSNSTSGSGETTLQVLRSVSEIKEPEEQNIEHCIQYLDDRFVTKRSRGSSHKSEKSNSVKKSGSSESFTISTPSRSSKHTSSSSLSEEGEGGINVVLDAHDSEDERPDSALLRDYQLTLSQALSEDEAMPAQEDDEELDQTLNAEEQDVTPASPASEYVSPRSDMGDEFVSPRSERHSSSVYETPETSLNDQSALEVQDVAKKVKETVESESGGARQKTSVPSAMSPKSENSKTFLGFDFKKKKTASIKPLKVIKSDSDIVNTPLLPVKSGTIIRPMSHRSREGSVESNPLERDAWGDSSSCSSLNSVKDSDTTQKTWRPLPPVPIESSESPKQSKTITKQGTGRKLPDPNQIQTKSPVVFQSNFMKNAYSSNTDSGDSCNKSLSPVEFQKPVITSQPRPLPPKPDSGKTSVQSANKNQNKDLNSSGAKTKISVDYSKLSADKDSGSESDKRKKRIPVAKALKKSVRPTLSGTSNTSVENQSDNNDIPFADDSEDDVLEEKFFTPVTSIKPKRPAIRRDGVEARKRLLPTPPKSEPAILSADKIRDIRKAEMEKARQEARERARLKSNEELGVKDTPYSKYKRTVSTESSQSTTDKVTDSEEATTPLENVTVTFTPDIPTVSKETPKQSKGKKKKKSKSRDASVSSTENLDIDAKKEKKKRSLLASILSGVKTPQKDLKDKDRSSSNDTLDDHKSAKKKGKTPKSEKKKKDKKKKTISVDDSLLADNMKDLKIGAVFIDNGGRRPGLKGRIGPPKASGKGFIYKSCVLAICFT